MTAAQAPYSAAQAPYSAAQAHILLHRHHILLHRHHIGPQSTWLAGLGGPELRQRLPVVVKPCIWGLGSSGKQIADCQSGRLQDWKSAGTQTWQTTDCHDCTVLFAAWWPQGGRRIKWLRPCRRPLEFSCNFGSNLGAGEAGGCAPPHPPAFPRGFAPRTPQKALRALGSNGCSLSRDRTTCPGQNFFPGIRLF